MILETLEIKTSAITSLKGIENAPALKNIQAINNEISDISALIPLESLEMVELSQNKFTSLGYLGSKPKMTHFIARLTPIETVDFSALEKYPHCSFVLSGSPFWKNASTADKNKFRSLRTKGHL